MEKTDRKQQNKEISLIIKPVLLTQSKSYASATYDVITPTRNCCYVIELCVLVNRTAKLPYLRTEDESLNTNSHNNHIKYIFNLV